MTEFDAIVVGGGHAGVEAAAALSRQNRSVLLVTLDEQKIGAMSCNPAIGGVAKSHLVFEIDALGGLMGWAADQWGVQSRRLNLNKGPAVRSTRIQCDKDKYQAFMSFHVKQLPGLSIRQGEVSRVLWNGAQEVSGVELAGGERIAARTVVVTSGTFMQAVMFCGDQRSVGGRFGDSASLTLSKSLRDAGHNQKRLKTGTPARLRSETIDFTACEQQWGDPEQRRFSWRNVERKLPQVSCYITYTNERTHQILRDNFSKSPLFAGDIQGVGPRYCPSVEDKVKRFADRDRHQIFLEPEGLDTNSIYPNGLSTSMPVEVQIEFLRSIRGLEKVELLRPGYAVEYDSVDPIQLDGGLQSKFVKGLFLAGQINRTSGYEEAAAQGLWAGINAGRFLNDDASLVPDRSRSYIETLVDDLVTLGSDEPYRMFTSRSEFRLLLREDNAAERMHQLGVSHGLLSLEQLRFHAKSVQNIDKYKTMLSSHKVRLEDGRVFTGAELMKRPEVNWETLGIVDDIEVSELDLERLEVRIKYDGYLQRQERELEELKRLQSLKLRDNFWNESLGGVSRETAEKIIFAKPATVFDLSRISGVTPAAVLTIAREFGTKPSSSSDHV